MSRSSSTPDASTPASRLRDFRNTPIEPGDLICYVGRQDMKASLTEARVVATGTGDWLSGKPGPSFVVVRPLRSSDPLGGPSGARLVRLTVLRKIVVIRKGRKA